MNNTEYTLNLLPILESGRIKELNCTGSLRRRLLDLGFVEDSKITAILSSPSKGLKAFDIRGTLIAIRDEDSSLIKLY